MSGEALAGRAGLMPGRGAIETERVLTYKPNQPKNETTMAVWTVKFVVRSKPEAWLRERWERAKPAPAVVRLHLRPAAPSCDGAEHLVFAEFLTLGGARGYERAAALELGGEGLAQFVERQLVDFYSGDAFEAALRESG